MALQRNTCSRYPGIKDSMNADCLGWVYYLPCHLGASPLSWVQLLIHTVWRLVPFFHSPPNSTLGQKPFHILSFFLTLFNIALFPVKTRLHPSGRASAQAILSENPWWGMQHRGPQASLKPSQWTETEKKSRDSGLNDLCYPLSKCSGTEVHHIWNFFWILEYFHPQKKKKRYCRDSGSNLKFIYVLYTPENNCIQCGELSPGPFMH